MMFSKFISVSLGFLFTVGFPLAAAQEKNEAETGGYQCNDWEAKFDYLDCHLPCASRDCNPLFSDKNPWPSNNMPNLTMPSQSDLDELGVSLQDYVQNLTETVQTFFSDVDAFWCAKDECCPECTEGSHREKECMFKDMNDTLTADGGLLFQFVDAGALSPDDVDKFIYKAKEDPCGVDCSDLDSIQSEGAACFEANQCACEFPANLTSDISHLTPPNTSEAVLMALESGTMEYCRAFKAQECDLKACCPQCETHIDHAYHCMMEPINQNVDDVVQDLIAAGAAISNGTDPDGTGNDVFYESDFKCYLWDNYCEPDTCQRNAVDSCVPACRDSCVAMAEESPRPEAPVLDLEALLDVDPFSNDTEGILQNLTSNIVVLHNFTVEHCNWVKVLHCRQLSCCSECEDELDFNFVCQAEEDNEDREFALLPYLITGLVAKNESTREVARNRTGVESLFVLDDFRCDISTNECLGRESLSLVSKNAEKEAKPGNINENEIITSAADTHVSNVWVLACTSVVFMLGLLQFQF